METKELFNLSALSLRPLEDASGLINALRRNRIVWCWGAERWTLVSTSPKSGVMAIRFKSNGYLHKGLVYLVVNGLDLFDIYLTTLDGKIKSKTTDIYLEDLIEIVDGLIETKKK